MAKPECEKVNELTQAIERAMDCLARNLNIDGQPNDTNVAEAYDILCAASPYQQEPCPRCNGNGLVAAPSKLAASDGMMPCPTCQG